MESQNIEYKQSWKDEYLKWICGFANAQGGTLYIGIDDNENVVGVDNAKYLLDNLPNKCIQATGIVPDFENLTQKGKAYLAIHIKASDHLGSASWITDFGGVAVQHIQYLPYGESYINQRLSGYNERFTFTGKERDEETGYSYHGARYYDAGLLTGWLSVDPLADKYPGISPYNYCAWNPVKLVDPDGMDIWEFDASGNIVNYIENSDYDQFQVKDASGNVFKSQQYEYGTISEHSLSGYHGTVFNVCGKDNAENVFEFLASCYTNDNNMGIEWGHATIDGSNNNCNFIGTDHRTHKLGLENALRSNGYQIQDFTHNHPSGDPTPSNNAFDNYSHGDIKVSECHPNTTYYTYTPHTGYSKYRNGNILDDRLLYFGLPRPISYYKSLSFLKKQ